MLALLIQNQRVDARNSTLAIAPRLALAFAIVLAVIHCCLATWFNMITPYRTAGVILMNHGAPAPDIGAPDERQHVNYVGHLLAGEGFPVFNPHAADLDENVENHQPPAFYLVAAGWAKLLGVNDVTSADGGHKLRGVNALIGGLGVIAVFALGLWGFGRSDVAVVAASFVALLPMNVALSSSVSNDPLLFALCSLALGLCAKAIRYGWTNRLALGIGITVGVAMLTKTTALALVPALLVGALSVKGVRPNLAQWSFAVVPALLVAAPWWVRNQQLYGDPFALTAFSQAFVHTAQADTFIKGFGLAGYLIGWVAWWTARSFLGAFGYMDIWLNESGHPTGSAPNALYRVFIAATVLIFIGWLASWKGESDARTRSVRFMNLAFLACILLLFLKFNLQYFQAQARYLLPAIGPIACGYAVGALQLSKQRFVPVLLAFVVVLGGISIYAGTRLPDEFAKRMPSSQGSF